MNDPDKSTKLDLILYVKYNFYVFIKKILQTDLEDKNCMITIL